MTAYCCVCLAGAAAAITGAIIAISVLIIQNRKNR